MSSIVLARACFRGTLRQAMRFLTAVHVCSMRADLTGHLLPLPYDIGVTSPAKLPLLWAIGPT
jgi:hypothetical protein